MKDKNLVLQMVVSALVIFFMTVLFMYVVMGYINLPIVYEDVSTGKCFQVVMYDGSLGDCNNLPEKYIHEYASNEK